MDDYIAWKAIIIVQSFFAVMTALFALGLPTTGAPFAAFAFFTVMTIPVAVFVRWLDKHLFP